jgi:hypothetical protein
VDRAQAASIVKETVNSVLDEQRAERQRFRAKYIWSKPDWSVWNVLSWIAFRDSGLLSEIEDEVTLEQVMLYGHPLLREAAPESLLRNALARGRLQAIRLGEPVPTFYWFGKKKVDRNTWFEPYKVLEIWPADVWSLAQMVLWIVTRHSQQVEEARACGLEREAAAIVFEQWSREQLENAASDLWERCRQGNLQSFNGPRPIDAGEWEDLEIVVRDDGVPFLRWRANKVIEHHPDGNLPTLPVFPRCALSNEAYPDIKFAAAGALREFPPKGRLEDRDVITTPQTEDCAKGELPDPAKKSVLTKKSKEDKEANALNIARTFVDSEGFAPNLKTRTTFVKES